MKIPHIQETIQLKSCVEVKSSISLNYTLNMCNIQHPTITNENNKVFILNIMIIYYFYR